MPNTWTPCPDGLALYNDAEIEAQISTDEMYTAVTRPAWFAWETHRDGCADCQSYKETK